MPARKATAKRQPKTPAAPDWRIKGDWWDLCNCAIGCPCVFGSQPTHGFCEGVLTWLIREGQFGDVRLDGGLAIVLIIHFEGSVFDKNREFGFLIDDRANPEQRDALERIFTGKAGGAFKPGRRITFRKETPMANLHLTLMDRMGVHVDNFGDASGRLDPASLG